MASSSSHLSDETSSVCVVELVESDESCTEQRPPNMTKVDEDASSSSTLDALKIETNGHGEHACKTESLAFEKFISTCTPHLKIPGDEPILAKLRKHYSRLDLECRQSDTFNSDLAKFILHVSTNDVYITIQEILNYFKSYHTKSTSQKQAHIKKLEKILGLLDKKIQELQAKEVDFDEEKNSTYILECRYKERFAFVYSKLCDIVGYSTRDPKRKIEYNGTRFPEINRNITRYLKKNDDFPDFKDVLEIIAETNDQAGLLMSEENISRMARQVFEEVGSKLKKRRIDEFESTFGCTLTDNIEVDDNNDPATVDTELREKLENNQKLAKKRLDEVMENFVVKQETRSEEEAAASNAEEEDGDDDEEDDEDDDDDGREKMEDIDEDHILVVEIETSQSETEESEVEHQSETSSCRRNSSSETDVAQQNEPTMPSKNGFLSELDIKPNVSVLTKSLAANDSHSSDVEKKVPTTVYRGLNKTQPNNRNPLRSVKRQLSSEDEVSAKQTSDRKRIALQTFVDDDVIVLSD
ncbi:death domain-associated protein 6-like isoform X2 [Daphnia carinata]|uniref:death domain-associated protein 6-like isoform X1 n=1 Tax=Daphnia carinata TaxID=120202 RepID=UPI00257A3076|nr:death domain-associated protein 6-like isoform X1 [Daphnia carinata]XP_057381496.1 death domain-associated protein 6-like isoform X2 [Daphnia carinata]